MSTGEDVGPEHPVRTRRRRLRYFFYVKHHQAGRSQHAQWARDLSREDEFNVFDVADFHDLSDHKGDLYGVRRLEDGRFAVIGTREEQVAEFPVTPLNQAWHGYPCWPILRRDDADRKARPPREAVDKMVQAGILQEKQASRLKAGRAI
ncbi:hypothetical protein [Paludisphaera rhizosphaerae]|uniref:hypothetical protein n=1 Tax=Paludisphaera rhizosphaerae TaxID=2711216 RepID=UPI0013EA1F89|nr:hypothetical protein [Paludisphaera rhizosphaerae]